jgi:predicted permease
MRMALGATRGRLLQQFLTESLLLSAAGAAGGLAVMALAAAWLSRVSLPIPLPVELHAGLDGRLLLFGAALVVVSTLVSGLAPALHATRRATASGVRGGESPAGRGRFRMRRVLVAGQVAASSLLLVIALVFVRNLLLTAEVDPGFDVDRVLVARVEFVEGRQGSAAGPVVERVLDRIRATPGVQSAAFTDSVPLTLFFGASVGTELRIGPGPDPVRADFNRSVIGPGFLETLGIAVRGREFTASDRSGAEPVAVVNDTFARQYFPGTDPIGQRIENPRKDRPAAWTVVGIAGDSRYRTLGEGRVPALYLSGLQADAPDRLTHVVARTSGEPEAFGAQVREAVLAVDPSAVVTTETMESALAFAFLPSRIGAQVLGALGALGAALAMVGLHGVIAYSVSQRTPELGVRMALGASRRSVAALVVRESAGLVAVGLAVGLGLGLLATRPLAAFLVTGLNPSDPAAFAATAVLLVGVSLLAVWRPVRRATRIDPLVALRAD